MKLKMGMDKILHKGEAEPDAVRFHVPKDGGGWSQVSWGLLLQRSRECALYLRSQGVAHNTKVAIFATTRVEWAYCCAAIEGCGSVFVPVYFSNTTQQVHYVVQHSDAEVLFTEMALLPRVLERWGEYTKLRRLIVWDLEQKEDLEQMMAGLAHQGGGGELDTADVRQKVLSLEQVFKRGAELHRADPGALPRMLEQRQDSDLAAIIYTSGTTGNPKGVALTNHNLAVTTQAWYQVLEHAFPPPGQRRDILWLPVSHMSGWGILGQGTIFEYETWLSDPAHLLGILPRVRPTMLLSVPAYWEKMYTSALNFSPHEEEQYARLRQLTGGALTFLLSGGAGLKREVKDFFKAAGIQMIEGYGLTECSPNLTMNRLDDYDFDSVGKPMPGVQLRLCLDGEILAKGENVFTLGYYKDPQATAECFDEEGWFHTGDLGQLTDRGFWKIIGRKKEIIVTSGGKNIGPAGIEAHFVGDPFLEHVVLFGDERKYLTALITLAEPAVTDFARKKGLKFSHPEEVVGSEEIRALVQERVDRVNAQLASYETIKKFHLHPGHLSVDEGHLTPSLKLRRAKVWESFRDQFEALYQ